MTVSPFLQLSLRERSCPCVAEQGEGKGRAQLPERTEAAIEKESTQPLCSQSFPLLTLLFAFSYFSHFERIAGGLPLTNPLIQLIHQNREWRTDLNSS